MCGRLANSELDDGFAAHVAAGVEYFINDRFSFVADARYIFTSQDLVIDQVNFLIFSEELFRPDGSVKLFRDVGGFPNPFVDPDDTSQRLVACRVNTVGDFDKDGRSPDFCYPVTTPVDGLLLVQGGKINLSGFHIQLGVRFYY